MVSGEACSVVIFLLVIIIIRIFFSLSTCSRRWTLKRGTNPVAPVFSTIVVDKILDDIEKPIRFISQQLRMATSDFSHLLGAGSFVAVYKGTVTNGLLVAVKVLHGSLDKKIEDQFLAEVTTIGRTHHMNLVQLYGFCFDRNLRALVYEFMQNSSLDRLLFRAEKDIEWEILYNIPIGTAKGITYLHEECHQMIIHYDIRPGNILLDTNFCPKVADFGLAKLCNREKTHVTISGGRGTPGYAAPEMWMPFPVTQKCDVYSFGMLLFEILGRRRNLDVNLPDSQEWFPRWVWKKYEMKRFLDVMISCSIQENCREKAKRIAIVALWCVQYKPDLRPSMSVALKMLEGGIEIPMPPNPFCHLIESPQPEVLAEVKGEACSFLPPPSECWLYLLFLAWLLQFDRIQLNEIS